VLASWGQKKDDELMVTTSSILLCRWVNPADVATAFREILATMCLSSQLATVARKSELFSFALRSSPVKSAKETDSLRTPTVPSFKLLD